MTVRFSKNCKCSFFFDNFSTKSLITSNVMNYLSEMGIVPITFNQTNKHMDATTSYEQPKPKKGICNRKKTIPTIKKNDITLELMPKKIVTLRTGQTMKVPARLHQLCNFILRDAEVKGIFKKLGSAAKQEDIKNLLNRGERLLPENANVIDVAQVVMQFLSELPVPVIPHCQHKFFLNCYDHADREDILTLACLLLPPNHVNLLSYLMQFFDQISTHHKKNKMKQAALAPCIGPILMPVVSPEDIKKTNDIMVILMQRADLIGMVPEMMTEESKSHRKKCCWMECFFEKKRLK